MHKCYSASFFVFSTWTPFLFKENNNRALVCLFCWFWNLKVFAQSVAFSRCFSFLYASECTYGRLSFKNFRGMIPRTSVQEGWPTLSWAVAVRCPGCWNIHALKTLYMKTSCLPSWLIPYYPSTTAPELFEIEVPERETFLASISKLQATTVYKSSKAVRSSFSMHTCSWRYTMQFLILKTFRKNRTILKAI